MKTILIVDDDSTTINLLKQVFKSSDIKSTVLTSSNAENALEVFGQNKIDLVITDIMMPKTSGYDLVSVISKLDESVPIVVITGAPDLLEGNIGEAALFEKPIDSDKIVSEVKALLRAK